MADSQAILDALKGELNAASPGNLLPADERLARVKSIIASGGASVTSADDASASSMSGGTVLLLAGLAYVVLKGR